METYATTKGQVVIPAPLRRKYGIRPGTKILVYDDGEHILLKPVTEQLVGKLQGSLKGSGALKLLMEERARDREREG
ncbi:MAG: AbrB/MazE/SpoVT family DNA-binding domain-containing protein [Chloroflexota bacterium]